MKTKYQQRRETRQAMQAHYHESDPHTASIKERLTETISTITSLREDVARASDPKIRVLFDTTREVLKDLVAAYELYERAKATFDFPEVPASAERELTLNTRAEA